MRINNLKIINYTNIKIIGESLNSGDDFYISSNSYDFELDYLLFFDSRGIGKKYEGSIAHRLVSMLTAKGKKYLIICRPLELTVYATLINFLNYNQIKPAKIITNLGFVDFTPKKKSILEDIIQQVEFAVGQNIADAVFCENYISSEGVVPIYYNQYKPEYRQAIEKISAKIPMVIINTPVTDPNIRIERLRPQSFYQCQFMTINFNRLIKHAIVVDMPKISLEHTYDAVHYTDFGNELIFSEVESYI